MVRGLVVKTLAVLASMALLFSSAWLASRGSMGTVRGHLSSKTPYECARQIKDGQGVSEGIPVGSRILYLYMVSRHGIRWPTEKNAARIRALEAIFEVADPTKDFYWVKNWKANEGKPGHLHPLGELEMRGLGSRFGSYFPDLLQQPYNETDYTFVSTQVERARDSALAFGGGLFPCREKPTDTQISQECIAQQISLSLRPAQNDSLLRFYKWCPAYTDFRQHIDPKIEAWTQRCWDSLIPKVGRKLGLPAGALTAESVGSLWKLCQQESSLSIAENQACSLFDDNDISLLEYCDDVKHFEAHGHADCRGYAMATALANDLFSNLQKAAQKGGERARFHFAHDHTLSGLAAWLGLFGSPGPCQLDLNTSLADSPLDPALPPPPADRAWWGSMITPFAANLAVLLYQRPSAGEQFVRLLWNEQAIPIPWCGNKIDCSLAEFLVESISDDVQK